METYEPSSHGLSNTMKGQGSMPLVQLGMDLGGTIHHSLVISKHLAHLNNGNPEVSESMPKVNDLLNTSPGSNKLRSIGGRFHSCLLLGVPINWGTIDKVQYPSDGSPSEDVVVQVGIHIMG